jgi:hypothetical protein
MDTSDLNHTDAFIGAKRGTPALEAITAGYQAIGAQR